MKKLCYFRSNFCCRNANSNEFNADDDTSELAHGVGESEKEQFAENEHHHDATGNSLTRKITADKLSHFHSFSMDHHQDVAEVEKNIIYVFLFFLLIFYFICVVRCIRIALDPYKTAGHRTDWIEAAKKKNGAKKSLKIHCCTRSREK